MTSSRSWTSSGIERDWMRMARASAITPMGTLMRKMDYHLALSNRNPPSNGPSTGTMTAGSPTTVMAWVAWALPALLMRIVCIVGMDSPAVNPCITQNAMRDWMFREGAHANEVIVKIMFAVRQTSGDTEASACETGDDDSYDRSQCISGDDPLSHGDGCVKDLCQRSYCHVDDSGVEWEKDDPEYQCKDGSSSARGEWGIAFHGDSSFEMRVFPDVFW